MAALLLLSGLAGCNADSTPAEPAGASAPSAAAPTAGTPSPVGEGFVVWESNRTGDWRIWWRRLDGSGLRQLSPEEPGWQHCCPHVSPDGRRVAYLSRAVDKVGYPEREVAGPLRLIGVDKGTETTLVPSARTYGWGDRCAVWRSDGELIYVAADGTTHLLDLAKGVGGGGSRPLTTEPRPELGWLIDPTLRFATHADPSFSLYDAERRRVLTRQSLGGCEPYFSADGRWGYWIAGGGGPIHGIDLATREISILLRKNDPRLPGKHGYLYFPMLSRDGRVLVFGASAGEHDHFRANYDVFAVPMDPATLTVVGDAVQLTDDPATDRYPDVYLSTPPAPPPSVPKQTPEVATAPGGTAADAGWPSRRAGLAFLWQTGDQPNLVPVPELGGEVSYPLTPRGRARLDHAHAMVLGGGAFAAPAEAAQRLRQAVEASNELSLEATLTPRAAASGPEMARILTLSSGPRRRSFTLGQQGGELVLRLRTGPTGPNGARPQVALFPVAPGEPVHVVVTYSPGTLKVYRDGERVAVRHEVQGALNRWEGGELLFGDEAGDAPEAMEWAGTLEGVALYGRVLDEAEVRENHARYRRLRQARPEVPRLDLRARLRARSRTPTLEEISPYRQALAVYEYELEAGDLIRVAHWVILDGEELPVTATAPGAVRELTLEPFADNPQLESHYLADTLEPNYEVPLYYAVADAVDG